MRAVNVEFNPSGDWRKFSLDFHPNDAETHFVFGGDLFDHGPGDLRMADSLLNFKQKYPEQVTLLAGNRDLNKLRLLHELDPDYLQLPPDHPEIFVPYWVPKKYITTLAEHLKAIERVSSKTASHSQLDFVPKSWRQGMDSGDVDSPEERLRWMLRYTMGAAGSFKYRQHELKVLRGEKTHAQPVSDQDVLNSFRDSVRPGGILREYLLQTDIMKVIGDTMFVHGALTPENVGRMPDAQDGICREANEWSSRLNNWKRERMQAWCNGHGGHQLQDYGVNGGAEGRTVVYQSWLDKEHYPKHHQDTQVASFLRRSGIQRVVSGVETMK